VLNAREAELYKLVFSSIDQREFLKLASLGWWIEWPAGQVLINKGQMITQAMIMVTGEIDAHLGDGNKVALHPGQLIGTEIAFSGLPSPADVVVVSPARVISWNLDLLRKFLEPRPELRSKLLEITSEIWRVS
jgi:CRP-like cAMP-binding protein